MQYLNVKIKIKTWEEMKKHGAVVECPQFNNCLSDFDSNFFTPEMEKALPADRIIECYCSDEDGLTWIEQNVSIKSWMIDYKFEFIPVEEY